MLKEELWEKYKINSNDFEIKKLLIEEYIYLVKIIAGRLFSYYGGSTEYDDLVSFGIFGLIDAIDKFDYDRDIKFESYAKIRIKGSIIDNLRKTDWIPRSVRKKAKEIEEASSKLVNELNREPTIEEIEQCTGIDKNEIHKTLGDIATFNIVSLDEIACTLGEYNFNDKKNRTPEMSFIGNEIKEIIIEKIEALPEKEKMVISLYYYDELTYKEIGKVMGLTESRISQIHSKAILMLKNILKKEGII
ncbi:sigma-70 family RNA polymerase sigma factor [Abyssisolibacter fermentans]|uniref:sigma-70 family RNA polymerase sigma factor n=1 Tax=Abyssisolibacter fermentans TaxID=1766203 RepID=UPI0008363F29|nr:FliA/WhiG family RNA polymerase sigma factor [Abyssisolibacter fermentans]